MCGYDPFYWYERELDKEFEENRKEIECLQQKNEESTSEEVTSQQ